MSSARPRRRKQAMARARAARRAARHWAELPDEELLDWRLCDLGLAIEGTAIEARVERLHEELELKGLRFRPYAWLSTDWFTPDQATGFAVPFFLAHPRLARLERNQMLEVEGGTNEWCLKIMRHETGHAIDNAYRLHRKKRWREIFGRFSEPYQDSYTPDPHSREYVLNLDYWYSQSHPAEDYAESFAVWLDPASHWRRRYAEWPALAKLEFIDELMSAVADRPRVAGGRGRVEPVKELRVSLREYYRRKRAVYGLDTTTPDLDNRLRSLFSPDGGYGGAAAFLRKHRRRLVASVARATAQHRYLIDHVLREMILRCRILRLRLTGAERHALLEAGALLTSLTMQFLYGGHPRYHR